MTTHQSRCADPCMERASSNSIEAGGMQYGSKKIFSSYLSPLIAQDGLEKEHGGRFSLDSLDNAIKYKCSMKDRGAGSQI